MTLFEEDFETPHLFNDYGFIFYTTLSFELTFTEPKRQGFF